MSNVIQCFGSRRYTEQQAAWESDGVKMSHVGLRHVLPLSRLQRHQPSTMHSQHRSIFSLTYLPRRLMHHLPAATAVVAGAFIFPALLSSYLNGSYNYLLCPETTRPMIILRSNVWQQKKLLTITERPGVFLSPPTLPSPKCPQQRRLYTRLVLISKPFDKE